MRGFLSGPPVRLTSIKLSGFKSFAEPTQFSLPGQLVGVVGPNGCGKSNIMDAVRWVLGESKASELRGESMQDVIFNGTNQRKPAGRASVELVFDNADRRAGGPWVAYAEVAVRRVLTRDGTSSYFINNQPVRRRDVHDVFLGTGLGPRAYAIIGQGTISRIIESRPEELRLFLEEAAGVSKYKERRRETAHRLTDTRENLLRVEDIQRELTTQLDKLEQQAEVATRYHTLQSRATLRQHQLWFLKAAEAEAEQARLQAEVARAEVEREARTAELRHTEAELEALRVAHFEAGDRLNQTQGRLYEAAAEVGQLEARIRFVVEGRQRASQRLQELQAQLDAWGVRRAEAMAEQGGLEDRLIEAEAQATEQAARCEEQAIGLPTLEEAWREAQQQSTAQRGEAMGVQQQIQVLAAEQRGLDEQTRRLVQRQERLRAEQQALDTPDEAGLAQAEARLAEAREATEEAEARLQHLQEQLPALEDACAEARNLSQQEAARQTDLAARLSALKALQDRLRTDGKLRPWLLRHGLEGLAALWTRLQIEPGWENALEAALRERLGSLEVSQLDRLRAFERDAPPTRLSFHRLPCATDRPLSGTTHGLTPLWRWLRLHDEGLHALLTTWLQGCHTAATLDEALACREQLGPGEVVYVPAGHAISLHGVVFYAPDNEQAGLLARAQEMDNLERQLKAQALIVEQGRATLVRAEAALTDTQQRLSAARREANEARQRVHGQEVEVLRLTQRVETARARRAQLGDDLAELDAQHEDLMGRRMEAEGRFEELDLQLADAQERHALLEDRALAAERALNMAREQARAQERRAQEAEFAWRSLQARQAEGARTLQMATQQVGSLTVEVARASEELARLDDAAAQAGLQDAMARKLDCEQALAEARGVCDDLAARLRAADEQRLRLEQALEPLRQRITESQLKEQAARLGVAQYTEQLDAAGVDRLALARNLAEEPVRLAGLPSEIDRLQREIQALGAVNLAALDELGAARERKTFLDAQCADLNEAIHTLEDAIRRIDAETRHLLADTFEQVNRHFGRMFPELFGGGQARLVMTGEEILDAGVQVMAQPPGKKNQTIHLLSGGEKALTAIALVFAIFQLNPAPFCLLDEVDAPLDDANTERYARLVTTMSRETQFLFISHNKIAMEMAQQLVGVTMQEQGVSRIVAVDMEAAAGLVETA